MLRYMASNQILTEARTWIGTRFQHQGRLKKSSECIGGCDCLGLIIGVARALQIKTKDGVLLYELDRKDYSIRPRDDNRLFNELNKIFTLKKEMDNGDIALMSIERWPYHLGILDTTNGSIIHACFYSRQVVERPLDCIWLNKIYAIFSWQ